MIRQRRWFPIIFMFVTTAFFSSVVIGFARFTSARVKANEELAFEKAVLTVLPGLYNDRLSRVELHRTFVDKVAAPDASTGGAYTLRDSGGAITYALPISGQGFWAPIKGVIGIKADKKTITGVAFYEQKETPGLGAEITKEPFRRQFDGKVMAPGEEPINIRRPSASLGKSEVHAVTGATQTSSRLEVIINTALNNWRQRVADKANQNR